MNQNHRFALRTTVVAALACAGMGAFAAPAFDANIEFDNTYLNNDRGLSQSGRVELNVASKAGTDYFVAARASYMAGRNGTAFVDDMWVQFGNSMVDAKLGRFEAADMFTLPRDALVLYAGGDANTYRANTLRGRTGLVVTQVGEEEATDGSSPFHGAVTFNAGGGLAVELGVIETKDRDTAKGVRPVVTYTGGPLTVKLGIEAIKWGRDATGDRESDVGLGISTKYDFGPAALLAHVATIKDAAGDRMRTIGLIADTTMGLTVGVILGKTNRDAGEDFKTSTLYAAYAMPLFGLKGATITPALSYSKGSGSNTFANGDDAKEKGVKLRFNYTF